MVAVGDKIDEMAKKYIELYERFRADDEFCDQASGLALATHDLRMQKHIAEEALARVAEYVRAKGG